MAKYRWETVTASTWNAGTDATVMLSLSGDKASMGLVEIADPDDNNDFEKGDVNHGLIETADLGMIQTGTIQHDGWGASPDWMLDSVKITNDEDGRVWLAGVNAELKGGQPKRLVFSLVDRGQYDIRLRQAKIDADKKRKDAEIADRQAEQERLQQEADQAATEGAAELARQKAELQQQLARAKNQAELDKLRNQINQAGGAAPPLSNTGPVAGMLRTYELFGVQSGRVVPLLSAVQFGSGRVSVTPGSQVMVTDQANEGSGLAGVPGRWQASAGGRSPADLGLDSDKGVLASDGRTAWPLSGQFLTQLFGSNWRQTVY